MKPEMTLQEKAKQLKKAKLKEISEESKEIYQEHFRTNTNPEMQLEVFNQYFLNQMKDYFTNKKDPYYNKENRTSIINFWHAAVGSLNTPVDIVQGDGPNRVVVGTVPSLIDSSPLLTQKEGEGHRLHSSVIEALKEQENNVFNFKKELHEKLVPQMKEMIDQRFNPEKHKQEWLDSLEKIEAVNQKTKKKQEPKKKKENTSQDEVWCTW